jgi:hypothetical protein
MVMKREEREPTGVIGKVGVLLALVESVLLLLLLDDGVWNSALVACLVDSRSSDVGLSRHVDCDVGDWFVCGTGKNCEIMVLECLMFVAVSCASRSYEG